MIRLILIFYSLTIFLQVFGQENSSPLDDFKISKDINIEFIELNDEFSGFPGYDLLYEYPLLIVKENQDLFHRKVFVVNLKNKELIELTTKEEKEPLGCGNGMYLTSINEEDRYYTYYDFMENEHFKVFLDSVKSGSFTPVKLLNHQSPEQSSAFFSLIKIDSRYVILFNNYEQSDKMFTVFDTETGSVINQMDFPDFPDLSEEERNIAKELYVGKIHYSPENETITLISQPTLLEVFNWENEQLTRRWSKEFYRYKFDINLEGKFLTRSKYDSLNKTGFLIGDVTDNYIYVGYSGKTSKEIAEIGVGYVFYILVYDWEGNPIIRYNLNHPIVGLAVKEDDSGFYGIAMTNEAGSMKLVEADFNH